MKGKYSVALVIVIALIGVTVFSAAADYIGPNRNYTYYTWERSQCNYLATKTGGSCSLTLYYPPHNCVAANLTAGLFNNSPTACGSGWGGTCGVNFTCNITLTGDNVVGCSSGETGCTSSEHSGSYPPATVNGTTSCSVPGNAGWCRGGATLTLSGNEPLAPTHSLTFFEGSPGVLCSAPSCSWSFPEGSTSLNFWVHSTYGDTSTMSSASMLVDTVAPSVGLSLPSPDGQNGWYRSSVSVSAYGSDSNSGVASQEVSLDNASWSPSMTISTSGTYTLYGRVTDVAGNASTTSTTIRIDTTPPSVTVTIPPPGSTGWYTSQLTFSASGSDTESGIAAIEYSVDGGGWQSSAPILSDGTHAVDVCVTDLAGNVSTSASTINIDTNPPSSAFSSPPEGSTTVAHGTITLSGSTSDTTSGPSTASISLNGGSTWLSLSIGGGGAWSYTWDTTHVSDGTYTVLVCAGDIAGNQEHTAQVTIVVENTPEPTPTSQWFSFLLPKTPTPTPTSTETQVAAVVSVPGQVQQQAVPTAEPTAVPEAPDAVGKPVERPIIPVIQKILWPAFAFIGLLAVLASASLSDRRPRELRLLARSLESTKAIQTTYSSDD